MTSDRGADWEMLLAGITIAATFISAYAYVRDRRTKPAPGTALIVRTHGVLLLFALFLRGFYLLGLLPVALALDYVLIRPAPRAAGRHLGLASAFLALATAEQVAIASHLTAIASTAARLGIDPWLAYVLEAASLTLVLAGAGDVWTRFAPRRPEVGP